MEPSGDTSLLGFVIPPSQLVIFAFASAAIFAATAEASANPLAAVCLGLSLSSTNFFVSSCVSFKVCLDGASTGAFSAGMGTSSFAFSDTSLVSSGPYAASKASKSSWMERTLSSIVLISGFFSSLIATMA